MAFALNAPIALAAVISVALAGSALSAGSPDSKAPEARKDRTAAEMAYADAPYGVDPMVTGPTSGKFKRQRQMSGCEVASWPNIPLSCYPD